MATEYSRTDRYYRRLCSPEGKEKGFQVILEETDLWITAEKDLSSEILDYIQVLRSEIKSFSGMHPQFMNSLSPVSVPINSPEIISRMAEAGEALQTGPMAAVAGGIAHMVAQEFVDVSPNLLVENGGDTYLYSTRERTVGILGDPQQGVCLGIRLSAEQFPCALCSSSATIGHSLSLGEGDLALVLAKDGFIADAAATALANLLQGRKGLKKMLSQGEKLRNKGVRGILGQKGEEIGAWGELELVNLPGG